MPVLRLVSVAKTGNVLHLFITKLVIASKVHYSTVLEVPLKHCWTQNDHFSQYLVYFSTLYSPYNIHWIVNTEFGLDCNNSVRKRLWYFVCTSQLVFILAPFDPRHEKTGFLPM